MRPDDQSLFGLPVRPSSLEEAVSLAAEAVGSKRQLVFGMLNAAKIVKMRRDPELFSAVMAADLLLADGMAVVWASRILGRALPERVTGIDLMHALLALASREGWRVYFLGARQEVLDAAMARAKEIYPGLEVAGSHHGYFDEDEEEHIVAAIERASPDLLFVGMGSPKKERFLARWAEETGAAVCHGVGGSFDVMAGLVRRAPAGMQRLGLEWLWRVMQEPGRLWKRYLSTNTAFSLMVAEALIARAFPETFREAGDAEWMPGGPDFSEAAAGERLSEEIDAGDDRQRAAADD